MALELSRMKESGRLVAWRETSTRVARTEACIEFILAALEEEEFTLELALGVKVGLMGVWEIL